MFYFKTILTLLFSVGLLTTTGCANDESNVANDVLNEDINDLDPANIVLSGSLVGQNAYISRGDVELFFDSDTDTYSLVINDLSSDDGPALFVYLSQGPNAVNITNLGALKALSGTIRYDFPASQFDPAHDHVLIWCRQVSRSFGAAELMSP